MLARTCHQSGQPVLRESSIPSIGTRCIGHESPHHEGGRNAIDLMYAAGYVLTVDEKQALEEEPHEVRSAR